MKTVGNICEHPELRIKFYESHNYDKLINVAENYVWALNFGSNFKTNLGFRKSIGNIDAYKGNVQVLRNPKKANFKGPTYHM